MSTPASLRALCVDDDADTRDMLGLYLRALGLNVTAAATAAEALPLIASREFDLFLLDTWLPDFDGIELCRQVRLRAGHEPLILIFSGAAYDVDRQRGLAAGANAYVFKPDVDELLKTLSRLIAEASAPKTTSRTLMNETSSVRLPSFMMIR